MIENRYRRSLIYRIRRVGNQKYLLGDSQCFELDDITELAWNMFNGRNTMKDILDAVLKEYNVSESEATEDLLELVTSMELLGVINRIE